MQYAYILQSIPHPDRFYHGSTSDLKKRLETHNNGGNRSTEPYRPWRLAWYAGFPSKQLALDFERYLKTASGKAFARKRLISGMWAPSPAKPHPAWPERSGGNPSHSAISSSAGLNLRIHGLSSGVDLPASLGALSRTVKK